MELADVAVLVSGSATGLAARTARRLASRGARVSMLGPDEGDGESLSKEVGGRFHSTDLTSEESVGRAIAAAEANHGFARVLVNCATTAMSLPLVAADGTTHPLAELRRSLEDNLVATFNVLSRFVTRLVHADLIGEERGVIVNTASIAASDGQIGQSAYAAAKAGVVGMTLPLARELAEHKIRVMTISPGMFATPGFMTLPSEIRAGLERRVPHPSRAGNVDEFARLVVEIVENPMLNGAVIRLDGAIRLAPT